MDLKAYFRRIREVEKDLLDPFVLVISEESDDGGKAGIATEVASYLAAKMIVERRARVATAEETKEFREGQAEARRSAEQLAAANRMHITVVPAKPVKL